jgi:catechol 2,3-dioxygenase-like lactoylglutathione lyase family enzyme
MEPRISLITLGVADLARSRAFYEALGWRASSASQPEIVFFQANGLALALFGRAALAEDAEIEDRPSGFSGVALAHNVRSEAEVDAVYAAAIAMGGQAVKLPRKAHWGGYSGYFADPDWHLWEVAFNPFFPLDEAGDLRLPE